MAKIPIINITSENTNGNFGGFGEYLVLLNYGNSYIGDTFNNSNNIDINQDKKFLTSVFRSNRVEGNMDIIKTIDKKITLEETKTNDIKFMSIIPIQKNLILPIPEESGKIEPKSIMAISNDKWFMLNKFFTNESIKLKNSGNLNKVSTNEGIVNILDTEIFFNVDIIFENQDNSNTTQTFQTLFKFKFSTPIISKVFFNFEFFENSLLKFLQDNLDVVEEIETENSLNMSTILQSNYIIKNININEIRAKSLNTQTYFNVNFFKKNVSVYDLNLKLSPDTTDKNILDYHYEDSLVRDNINKFAQRINNTNVKLFTNIFNNKKLIDNTEEVIILHIENEFDISDTTNPNLEKIKTFIKTKLLTFLDITNIFPNDDNFKTIPSEITYNSYDGNQLIEIGKRQIILTFARDINLGTDDLYSDVFIFQFNIATKEFEIIPILDPRTTSKFNSLNLIKSNEYNLYNIQKSFRLRDIITSKLQINLGTYSNFTLFNNFTKTNIYQLKIIRNYSLNQLEINGLL